MKKIEAYKTTDGLIFEDEEQAYIHELNLSVTKNVNFTKAEHKVYDFAINGLSNQEIADELDLQLVTVKKHIGNLLKKSGVASRFYLIVNHYRNI